MPFRVAALFHQFEPRDRRSGTAPEIFAALTFDDYAANRDPVFQAILDYAPGRGFKDIAGEFAQTKDLASFLAKYKAFKANPKNRYAGTEADMNALGYRLLGEQKRAEAIEVFKLNVEACPDSANAFDSLAEGYLTSGNKEEAGKKLRAGVEDRPEFCVGGRCVKEVESAVIFTTVRDL